MEQTILLTGGAGYIGSHTYVTLVEAGYRVVILDDFSNSKSSVLMRLARLTGQNKVPFYEGSVLDGPLLDHILKEENVQAAIHFAAKKAVGESVTDPLGYCETNVGGLMTLLQAMKRQNVRNLVFSSTATVYGDAQTVPTPEDSPLDFTNPYAFTKLTSEHILRQAEIADPWAFGILRYFNPVGAHPSGLIGEDPNDIPNNLMPFISKVANGDLPHLQVFGDDYPTTDGSGERDYVHVMDLARGHLLSLNRLLQSGESHTVNLGTGRPYSVLEVIAAYSEACGRDIPYKIAPRRAGDVAVSQADVSHAKELLDFVAEFDLKEMCDSSWHWIMTGAKEG
ncbi:MAG: UDP-glucose 4-epimerase GalE [Aliishimia sp.]